MIVLGHTAPLALLVAAAAVATVLVARSFRRNVPADRPGLAILVLRALFFALLLWCLLQPELRRSLTRTVKPRFAVALDTSGSMTLAAAPGISNRWQNAGLALRGSWVQILRRHAEVDVHPFSAREGPRLDVEQAWNLSPDGQSTLLRESLRRIVDRYRGQKLGGLLLLSDGVDTQETSGEWTRESWPCPLYTVTLEPPGLWEAEPDLRVDSVSTPRRVTAGWNTELKAVVSGQGTRARPVGIQLFRDGAFQQEVALQIPNEGGSREATFKLAHDKVGTFLFRVLAPPLRGESVTNDNTYTVSVQVVDTGNRLLYVEGPPRWESKFLTRALRANRQVAPVCFVQGPEGRFLSVGGSEGPGADMTDSDLALYKIVILGNLSADELGPRRSASLAKFVESGGSLVLLGGSKAWGTNGFLRTALQPLVPVRQVNPAAREETSPVALTPEGQSHAAFAGDKAAWERVPPVLSVFADAAPAAGAQVLAVARLARGPQPLVVAQRYGQGKVVALLTDSLWRWQLSPEFSGQRPHQRFWDQLLAWLSPTEKKISDQQVDLFADTERVFLGGEVELSAQVGSGGKEPAADTAVQCEIAADDGRITPFLMARQQVTTPSGKIFPGFAFRYKAETPGLHTARAVATIAGQPVSSDPVTFFVKPYTPELVPRSCDTEVLAALARGSGGKHFTSLEQMNNALASLWFESGREESVEYASLWQRAGLIACLLLLLCLEWALRKWRNMP